MTAAYSGRVANVNVDEGKNFKIVWPGSIYAMDSWVIMKGGPNSSGAMDLLAFMGDPQLQADWMQAIPYGASCKQGSLRSRIGGDDCSAPDSACELGGAVGSRYRLLGRERGRFE